jgi:pimeloyl-ACP methyl ester carboxylesterase
MKWLTSVSGLAAVAIVGFVFAPGVRADVTAAQGHGIAGNWEGLLKVTPQIELRIVLDLKESKDGTLSGNWASPDEALKDLPFDSLAFKNSEIAFHANFSDADYKGTMNKAGTEIEGTWTQRGKRYPMTFKRFDPAKVSKSSVPKELEGIWEGKIAVQAAIELRLVLKVEKGKDGELKASLVSPDQSPIGIPISSIALKDGEFSFESKRIGAKYTGKRNKAGNAFEGTFMQMGTKFPLVLKKTDKMSEYRRPQTPKAPFPYRSENVAYENKAAGIKLAGTLTIPQGAGPFAAVILLTGSGAQDRDETLLGHKPFLVLADYLSRRGIAVLRVDDRGVGGSTGSPIDSTTEDFAGDALAGVAFLKGRTEIDPKKIGLAGHSEGGLTAPIAAARSGDVAFVVMMAGTGMPGTDILVAQGRLILKVMGAPESVLKSQERLQTTLFRVIDEGKDEKTLRSKLAVALKEILASMPESERNALGEVEGALSESALEGISSRWWRFFLHFDPRTVLHKVHCPVLALNGEKDLQVPCKENLAEIAKALKAAGNEHVTTVVFPGLNHLFQPCKTGAPSEYAAIETTIDPQVLKAIGDWILEQTGGEKRG